MKLKKYRKFSEVKLPVHEHNVTHVQKLVLEFAQHVEPSLQLRNVWLSERPIVGVYYPMRIPNERYREICDYIIKIYDGGATTLACPGMPQPLVIDATSDTFMS